jgi:putative tryptophan/tyrosine transport system substrate-binding protein
MKRREFITLLGGAAAVWPLAARAQQTATKVRRIGVLLAATSDDSEFQAWVGAFQQGLAQSGCLARTHAAQLIGLMPDVILAVSTTNLMVVQQAANTVPVVFVQVSDPVAQGFVASVAKPGGNLTGFSMYELSIGGKWVDLLKAAAPALARVAVMFNPETSPQSKFFMRSVEAALPSLGVQAIAVPVHYRRHRVRDPELRPSAERRVDPAHRRLHTFARKADR